MLPTTWPVLPFGSISTNHQIHPIQVSTRTTVRECSRRSRRAPPCERGICRLSTHPRSYQNFDATIVTTMGHRLHTEEIVIQTKAADGWAYYQAKNSRFHMYAADAKIAALIGPQGSAVAADWERKADEEKRQAEEARGMNERLDEETV